MIHQIELMGGYNLVVSTNLRRRQDGGIFAVDLRRGVEDPGVAVYFQRGDTRVCFCCDRYHHPWENMRAIGKTIEAMRGIERWGSAEMLDRAFTGFEALPPPKHWSEILDVPATASKADINAAWRRKVKGATEAELYELNAAKDAAFHDG